MKFVHKRLRCLFGGLALLLLFAIGVPGNRWRYANRDSKIYIPYNGTPSERHWEGRSEVVQARMEELHGRVYMREEIGIPDTVLTGGAVRWRRRDAGVDGEVRVTVTGDIPTTAS